MTAPTTPAAPAPQAADTVLRLTDVHTYYGASTRSRASTSRSGAARSSRSSAPTAPARRRRCARSRGLLHARQGTVELDGDDITKVAAHTLVNRGIGHAPEGRRIFSRLTIYENLLMGGFTRTNAENEEQVAHVYDAVPAAQGAPRAEGRHAVRRRAADARDRAGADDAPAVLLLDEPSLGLAPILVQQIFKIIREINEAGMTILLVEQNALQALSIANRGYVLQTGEVVLSGDAQDLMVNETVRKAYLGED